PSYEIRDIPGKGKGVVALRDIAMGEMVIIERPIFLRPLMITAGLMLQLPKLVMERMDPRDRASFFALSNVKDPDVPQFWGIIGTNAFELEMKEGVGRYGAVFPECSRLNHSCGPNTTRTWNLPLFALIVQASRNIRAGEEITTWYEELTETHTDRRSDLERKYKFKCACGYCT
ncbi:hypothetical protein M422DRAFT_146804, partial [Sphaerobolus stellatus SS14]